MTHNQAIIVIGILIIISFFLAGIILLFGNLYDNFRELKKFIENKSQITKSNLYGDFINNFVDFYKDKELRYKDGNPRNYDISNIEVVKKISKRESRG